MKKKYENMDELDNLFDISNIENRGEIENNINSNNRNLWYEILLRRLIHELIYGDNKYNTTYNVTNQFLGRKLTAKCLIENTVFPNIEFNNVVTTLMIITWINKSVGLAKLQLSFPDIK